MVKFGVFLDINSDIEKKEEKKKKEKEVESVKSMSGSK